MRNIPPSNFFEVLPVVSVYESDLQDILDTVSQRPHANVVIQHGEAEFESIEDLRAHRGELLRTLTIRADVNDRDYSDYGLLSVSFTSRNVLLHADSVFELQHRRIKDILLARRRISGRIPDPLWFSISPLIFLLLVATPHIQRTFFALPRLASVVLDVVCDGIALAMVFGQIKIRRNLIVLGKRHEHQTFLKRHEQSLVYGVVAVVAAVISAVTTYILTKTK